MKKGVLIDLIYKNIGGGRPNTDISVTKAQIAAVLPAICNYVNTGSYWDNLRLEGDREVPSSFVDEVEKEIKIDSRGRKYVDLTESLIDVGGNGGVRLVEDSIGNVYGLRSQGAGKSHWDDVLVSIPEYSRQKKKLIIHNSPTLVDKLYVYLMLSADDLEDDDELPIPSGKEPEVIDMLLALFRNQRMTVKDFIINGVDPRQSEQ